tara:strand:- start:942 stop:1124 length:183 start_codon:yes stop_codon:yes gene_type:complete
LWHGEQLQTADLSAAPSVQALASSGLAVPYQYPLFFFLFAVIFLPVFAACRFAAALPAVV